MLWTALGSWIVLCLTGFAAGDDDSDFLYWYPGRRKLASADDYDFYSNRNDYLEEYVDDYPVLRENYYPTYRAEYGSYEDNQDRKRSQVKHYIENANPFLGNYLSYTKLSLYNRNQKVQVIKASQWFENFDKDKDLAIIVHGVSNDVNYIEDFFNTIAYALLQNADYNVIGVDWRHFILKEKDIFDIERNAEEAIKIGHVVNSVLERALDAKHPMQVPRTSYIGHDLGVIPVVVQSTTYGIPFDTVYGLNLRPNLGSHDYLTLTQMHGRLVNTISTLPYPYSLSHRDFRPIYNKDFYYKGNYANLAYQILANAIIYGNMTARFCSNEEDYLKGYCSRLTEIPIWYRRMSLSCGHPVGRYFFELPPSRLKPYCDGQAYIQGGHS